MTMIDSRNSRRAEVMVRAILMSMMLAVAGYFCAASAAAQSAADRVFTNARIYTVNENQPWAEAIALTGCGKTQFTGADLSICGRFRLQVERNCTSGCLPVVRQSLAGIPCATEPQVGHSSGLIRTRL